MNFDFDYQVDGDGVATITFDRPERLNAITLNIYAQFRDLMESLRYDDAVKAIVLTGRGKAFCSGGDVHEIIGSLLDADVKDHLDFTRMTGITVRNMRLLDKPIIAAINGTAVAGGCELVQGTDIRVAADTARFGVQEVQRALFPGGGSSVRLPVQLPYAVAMEWLLTGELVSAARAYELGFVNRVVPVEQVVAEAMTIAERIAANGPVAVRAIKASAKACLGLPEREAMDVEARHAAPVFRSRDAIEGPKAFMEKRAPVYEGR